MNKNFVEGVHYVYDNNGLMVMTEEYHRLRGTCCGSVCKNCPYEPRYIKGNFNLKK